MNSDVEIENQNLEGEDCSKLLTPKTKESDSEGKSKSCIIGSYSYFPRESGMNWSTCKVEEMPL